MKKLEMVVSQPPHPSVWVPSDRNEVGGMNVVFINMPVRESAVPNNIPLGPALMAGRLRDYGANPSIIDLNAYRPHKSPEEMKALFEDHFSKHGTPDVVGFSGLITTLGWQEHAARYVRELAPQSYIVSGGGLATDLPEHVLQWIPELDGVATGEGDDIIFKIVRDGKKVKENGITDRYRRRRMHATDSVYRGTRPLDLDALSFPAWDLVPELEMYLGNAIWGSSANNSSATPFTMTKSMNTVSSRGCPFACTYCDRTAQGGRNYGLRSAEDLAEEVQILMDTYGIDFLGITDDNAMVRKDRLKAMVPIFEPFVKRGLRWGTHGRLDEAADFIGNKQDAERRVEYMVEAGCVYIGFGAESADPQILEVMGKGGKILSAGMTTWNGREYPRAMVEGLMNCYDVGIHPNCTWIMGYPGETLEQLKTSISFIAMMEEKVPAAANNHSMFVATAYPGTELFHHPTVRERFQKAFSITDCSPNDLEFKKYVAELDDATKAITGPSGVMLNYSAMDDKTFLKAREYIDAGKIFDVLKL